MDLGGLFGGPPSPAKDGPPILSTQGVQRRRAAFTPTSMSNLVPNESIDSQTLPNNGPNRGLMGGSRMDLQDDRPGPDFLRSSKAFPFPPNKETLVEFPGRIENPFSAKPLSSKDSSEIPTPYTDSLLKPLGSDEKPTPSPAESVPPGASQEMKFERRKTLSASKAGFKLDRPKEPLPGVEEDDSSVESDDSDEKPTVQVARPRSERVKNEPEVTDVAIKNDSFFFEKYKSFQIDCTDGNSNLNQPRHTK